MEKQQITRVPLKYGPILQTLPDDVVGKIFKNILLGSVDLKGLEKIYFDLMMVDIKKIDEKAEKGKTGGRPKEEPEDTEEEKPKVTKKQKPKVTENDNLDKISIDKNSKDKVIEDSIPKEQQSGIIPENKIETYGQADINDLIVRLKLTCDELGIAYNKDMEREFGKHICTAKEFGQFAEKIGSDRVKFACDILRASKKTNFRKGICSGPRMIYQNYAEVYNAAMETKKKGLGVDVIC